MKTTRVLKCLLSVALDLPVFDEECQSWCEKQRLITRTSEPTDLTLAGVNLLNNTVQHFGAMLLKFHQSGQLKAETNDQKDDHNTNEQAGHGKRESTEDGNQKELERLGYVGAKSKGIRRNTR